MLLPILASATIGGIIGYTTNWVAIKMLFRPLTEKRIWGIRLPFTPGVIPRQREALAKSIGNAVGAYLITSESLSTSSQSEIFTQSISSFIEQSTEKLKQDSRTLEQIIDDCNWTAIYHQLNTHVSNYLKNILNDKESLETITKIINERLAYTYSRPIKELLPLEPESFQTEVARFIKELTLNDNTQIYLQRGLKNLVSQLTHSNKTLREIFNDSLRNNIEITLDSFSPHIIDKLIAILNQAQTKELIQEYLKNFFSNGFLGNLLNSFLPPNVLTDTIITQLTKILNDDKTRPFVSEHLKQTIDTFYDVSVKDIMERFDSQNISNQLTQWLQAGFSDENINHFSHYLAMSLTSQDESISQLSERFLGFSIQEVSAKSVSKIITKLTASEEFYHALQAMISKITTQLLQIRVKTLACQLDTNKQLKLTTFMTKLSRQFIEKYGLHILQAIDVPNMVENQVNKLDILDVEEIILSVMRTQLKAITNFGLLLGALLGLIMPFINNFLGKF